MTKIDGTISGVKTGLELAPALSLRLRIFSYVMRACPMTELDWSKPDDKNRLDHIRC
jgi:hypothetical protein